MFLTFLKLEWLVVLMLSYVFPSPERAVPFDHMMYEHLQKWGPRKQEVKFYLRHEDSPTESSDQGENTPT